MKIYTRKGDKGKTSLIGGTKVSKHHPRIEAYGSVDELNSHIGLIRDQEACKPYGELLKQVQSHLFTIGSLLAADPERSRMKLGAIQEQDILLLEREMDRMENTLQPLQNFILPGGHAASSYCHIARCVCRRAERRVTELSGASPVEEIIIKYLNRLSDYLFVLARKVLHDAGGEETPWKGSS